MIKLSILIPSLPSRLSQLKELLDCIQDHPSLEIIVLTDNRRRMLGAKRNVMMAMAQGEYVMHCDDDELLAEDFVQTVIPLLDQEIDLLAYDAGVSFNGLPEFKVTSVLGAACEHPKHLPDGRYSDIVRPPWHWNCWRTSLARRFKFPENIGYGEDWLWLKQILPEVRTWHKIDRILFHHRWSAEKTEFKPNA